MGFSLKETIQLLGYPHDYGNLHMQMTLQERYPENFPTLENPWSALLSGNLCDLAGADMPETAFGGCFFVQKREVQVGLRTLH